MRTVIWSLIILSIGACCKPDSQEDYPGPYTFHNIAVKLLGIDSLNSSDLDTLIRKTKTTRQDSVSLAWRHGYEYDTFAMANSSDSFILIGNGKFSGFKQRLSIAIQWEGDKDTVWLYNRRHRWTFVSRAWQYTASGTNCKPRKTLVNSSININGEDCNLLKNMQSSNGFDIENQIIYLKK